MKFLNNRKHDVTTEARIFFFYALVARLINNNHVKRIVLSFFCLRPF